MFRFFALCIFLMSAFPTFAACQLPSNWKFIGSATWLKSPRVAGAYGDFERLPWPTPTGISAAIGANGRLSAGLYFSFKTTSPNFIVCIENVAGASADYPIMSQTGASGFDIYYRSGETENDWRWLTTAEVSGHDARVVQSTVNMNDMREREFLVNMALFQRYALVRLMVPVAATVTTGNSRSHEPIVVLGTSIDHGSGLSRPGAGWIQTIGRELDADTVNLGFTGSCQMQTPLADLIASIDASVYILNCFANMNVSLINSQMYNFVDRLATLQPNRKIAILEYPLMQSGGPAQFYIDRHDDYNTAAYAVFQQLQAAHSNIFWCDADGMQPNGGTVDGTHLTDLGNRIFADHIKNDCLPSIGWN